MTSMHVGTVPVEPARIVAVPEGLGELCEEPAEDAAFVVQEVRGDAHPLKAVKAVSGPPDALRLVQVVHGPYLAGRHRGRGVTSRRGSGRPGRIRGAYARLRCGSRQYAQQPLGAPCMHRSNIGHHLSVVATLLAARHTSVWPVTGYPTRAGDRWPTGLGTCLCHLSDRSREGA